MPILFLFGKGHDDAVGAIVVGAVSSEFDVGEGLAVFALEDGAWVVQPLMNPPFRTKRIG